MLTSYVSISFSGRTLMLTSYVSISFSGRTLLHGIRFFFFPPLFRFFVRSFVSRSFM